MFEDFASDILQANIASRAEHMKNCAATAMVTGVQEVKTRDGTMAVIDLLLLKVIPRDPNDSNVVGEKVGRTYPLYGTKNKKDFFSGLLKKDMCHLADVDYKKVSGEQWKAIGGAAGKGDFIGTLVSLDPYEFETNGEKRVGHNFTKVPGKNTPADVTKRATLLAKGETNPGAFL
ncbi:MAG: hypothetical protein IPJ65_38160 [Archangiaceae bacterium]|nr:hypothetical protein [Archangiaceae bacterium]